MADLQIVISGPAGGFNPMVKAHSGYSDSRGREYCRVYGGFAAEAKITR